MENNNFDSQETLKRMQACQLVILKELKRVCENNDIPFYLAYGSALGAVRHKGFIPWDDDVDVFMYLEDFERLKTLQNQFSDRYYVQDHEKEPEYGLLIGRIRDSETTLIEKDHFDRDINHGVYIDIYPLFNFGGNAIKRKILVASSFLCRLLAYNAAPMNKGKFSTTCSKIVLNLLPKCIKIKIEKCLYKWLTNQPESGYVASIPDVSNGKYYPSNWFEQPVLLPFEDDFMPVPSKYIEHLEYEYGDYMTPPPEDKRIIHHGYLFADFERSYSEYKGSQYCLKEK